MSRPKILNDKEIRWANDKLSEGYTQSEVEYIENKNNAYIATGIMGGLDTYGCEIKLQSTLPKGANGLQVFRNSGFVTLALRGLLQELICSCRANLGRLP